jgi:DNA-binding FadR family transcriptional regulator
VSIESSVRTPAYQLLADDLRTRITSGRLRPGQRLPTEPELCAEAGVSRSTVREALRLLSSQHLIVTTRGVTGGSFVAAHRAFHTALAVAAGNPLYELITSPLYAVANERELADVAPTGFWVAVDLEHREILRCIEARDAPGAQRAATLHLARLRTTWPTSDRPLKRNGVPADGGVGPR